MGFVLEKINYYTIFSSEMKKEMKKKRDMKDE